MSLQQPAFRPILIYALYAVVLSIIQVTVLQDFRVFGLQPDLTLILAILTGYLFGKADGLWVGLGAGFLRDMLAGRTLGLGMLLLMYAALLARVLLADFFRRKTWMGLVQVLLITILYELIVTLLSWFFPLLPDQVPAFSQLITDFVTRLPVQGFLNVAAAVPLLLLLRYRGPYDPRKLHEDLDDGSTGEGKWRTI